MEIALQVLAHAELERSLLRVLREVQGTDIVRVEGAEPLGEEVIIVEELEAAVPDQLRFFGGGLPAPPR